MGSFPPFLQSDFTRVDRWLTLGVKLMQANDWRLILLIMVNPTWLPRGGNPTGCRWGGCFAFTCSCRITRRKFLLERGDAFSTVCIYHKTHLAFSLSRVWLLVNQSCPLATVFGKQKLLLFLPRLLISFSKEDGPFFQFSFTFHYNTLKKKMARSDMEIVKSYRGRNRWRTRSLK